MFWSACEKVNERLVELLLLGFGLLDRFFGRLFSRFLPGSWLLLHGRLLFRHSLLLGYSLFAGGRRHRGFRHGGRGHCGGGWSGCCWSRRNWGWVSHGMSPLKVFVRTSLCTIALIHTRLQADKPKFCQEIIVMTRGAAMTAHNRPIEDQTLHDPI